MKRHLKKKGFKESLQLVLHVRQYTSDFRKQRLTLEK
jgi:hypothetical protein